MPPLLSLFSLWLSLWMPLQGHQAYGNQTRKGAEPPSASFNCEKASSPIEKKICSDNDYRQLDYRLGRLYNKKFKSNPHIKDSQKTWLLERDQCLKLLPADTDICLYKKYLTRLEQLGGPEQIEGWFSTKCLSKTRDCFELADFYLTHEKYKDAEPLWNQLCQESNDGDLGLSCLKHSISLEKNGKKAEAIVAARKSCESAHNPEACSRQQRLSNSGPTEKWFGLYHSPQGPLFLGQKKDKKTIEVSVQTSWPNGHLCNFWGEGELFGQEIILKEISDYPECKLKIHLKDSGLTLEDPGGNCRRAYCGARGLLEGDFKQ